MDREGFTKAFWAKKPRTPTRARQLRGTKLLLLYFFGDKKASLAGVQSPNDAWDALQNFALKEFHGGGWQALESAVEHGNLMSHFPGLSLRQLAYLTTLLDAWVMGEIVESEGAYTQLLLEGQAGPIYWTYELLERRGDSEFSQSLAKSLSGMHKFDVNELSEQERSDYAVYWQSALDYGHVRGARLEEASLEGTENEPFRQELTDLVAALRSIEHELETASWGGSALVAYEALRKLEELSQSNRLSLRSRLKTHFSLVDDDGPEHLDIQVRLLYLKLACGRTQSQLAQFLEECGFDTRNALGYVKKNINAVQGALFAAMSGTDDYSGVFNADRYDLAWLDLESVISEAV